LKANRLTRKGRRTNLAEDGLRFAFDFTAQGAKLTLGASHTTMKTKGMKFAGRETTTMNKNSYDSRALGRFRNAAVALLVAAFVGLVPQSSPAQTISQILSKVYVARGGLTRIRALRSERVSGTISFGAEASGPFSVELKRPMKMRMTLAVQNQTMIRVYDGAQGWANNPFAGKLNPDAMGEEDLKNISEEADFDGPLVDYAKKSNKVELVGKDKVEETEVWRVKLTTKNGDVRYYLFDAKTFLLLKWEGKRRAEGKDYPIESYFHDYRDVGGLKFAFEIDSGSSATDLTQKLVIDKIELNVNFADSDFTKPAAPDSGAGAAATSNP
jgi:outer membrane lipoprotein-sorting protein